MRRFVDWCIAGFLAGVFVAGLLLVSASAATVNLAWDKPNPATGVAGYSLHFGAASRTYTQTVNVAGNADTLTATLDVGLGDARKVYIAATSRDAAGNRSAYSNEVSWDAPDDLPPGAPLNFRIQVSMTQQADGSYLLSAVKIFPTPEN